MTDIQELEIIEHYIKEKNIPTFNELAQTDVVTLKEIDDAITDFHRRSQIVLNKNYLVENAKKIIDMSSIQSHEIFMKSQIVDISIVDLEKENYIFTLKRKGEIPRQINIGKDDIGYYVNPPSYYPISQTVSFVKNNENNFKHLIEISKQIKLFSEYDQLPINVKIDLNTELQHYLTISEEGIEFQRYNKVGMLEDSILNNLYIDNVQDIQYEYLQKITIPLSDIKECEGKNLIKEYVKR